MNQTRKDKRFGNRYILVVQHKDSGYTPFFVSDDDGSLTSSSLEAKTFEQGKSIYKVKATFNSDYIFTKILMTHDK